MSFKIKDTRKNPTFKPVEETKPVETKPVETKDVKQQSKPVVRKSGFSIKYSRSGACDQF